MAAIETGLLANLTPPPARSRGLQDVADVTRTSPPISASYNFDMGPNRPYAPNESIIGTVARAVGDVLGPDASFTITSGQEGPYRRQYGSNRHKTGQAADVAIYDANGNRITAHGMPQTMQNIARAAAARGAKGIGFGTNYMGGSHMHIDRVSPGPGQAHTWGNMGRQMRNELVGIMREPIPYLSQIGAIPTPANSGRGMTARGPNAAPPGTMADSLAAAPVDDVRMAALGYLPEALPAVPVGNVDRAGTLPSPASPAPISPESRGLLANVPQEATAAPMSPVQRAGSLPPAAYGGDPVLANAGGFVSPLARDDGSVYFDGSPTTGMAEEFPFTPTGQAGPNGEMPLAIGRNGIGESFPAHLDRTYQPVTAPQEGERRQLALYDAQTRPVPMIAEPSTMAPSLPPAPVESVSRGLLSDIPAPGPVAPLASPVKPLAPPVNVDQFSVASPSLPTPASMPVPTGEDVWSGASRYGMDTAGGTLYNAGRDIYRYSPEYDTTSVYRNGQWLPANNAMRGETDSGFDLPSRNRRSDRRLAEMGKGFAGGAAGGLLASVLGLGPLGGLLAASAGRSLAQGQGLSAMFKQGTHTFPTAPRTPPRQLTQSEQQRITDTFGYSGATPGGGDPMSRSYAPAAFASIERGETIGLF